ncbi:MAG: Acylphosphatase [Candidatus Methanomarinus sp.]|nr:MAG: Acylphosphatase [ANME-2 cluster archaeon]
MNVRVIIIAKGEVQRVGYRDVVERAARKMKLTGNVSNLKPYDVKIICEGDNKSIDSFIELITLKEYPVIVEHMDVIFEDATGEFEYFEIIRGDMTEELGERLDMANAKLTLMIGKQGVMIEKQDVMIEKQDVLIEKVEDNTSTLNNFKNETNNNLDKLTNIMIKHDVDAQERIATLTAEISQIKERLSLLESAVA